jgi:hypothetical protein
MQDFIICSYYTYDTPYQGVAHEFLMPSVFERKIPADIRGIMSLGNWNMNTSYKPTYIKKMLLHHKNKNIVFLDVDAEVLSYPELFENIPEEYNIAVHMLDRDSWYQQNTGVKELLSGTLFIRNCKESLELVDKWIDLCASKVLLWEQKLLQELLEDTGVKIYELPLSYCYIKTLPNGNEPHVKCEDPVVVHHQCSRLYRNQIK